MRRIAGRRGPTISPVGLVFCPPCNTGTPDDVLLSFQDLGKGSLTYLRETLRLPSTGGVRPSGKKPS
jgi:hypothetical protein